MIELKNIDLNGWNGVMQSEKIKEELKEFREAAAYYLLCDNDEAKEHAIEEYFDLIQSSLGLLSIVGISAEEVMKEYPKHLEKLKSRPRIKKCNDCIYRNNCKLYLTEHWDGEEEAKNCKMFDDGVR